MSQVQVLRQGCEICGHPTTKRMCPSCEEDVGVLTMVAMVSEVVKEGQ